MSDQVHAPEEIADLSDYIQSDNGLFDLGHYMAWPPREREIVLDSRFSLPELKAIVAHMEKYSK
jgi:hypothetical protein